MQRHKPTHLTDPSTASQNHLVAPLHAAVLFAEHVLQWIDLLTLALMTLCAGREHVAYYRMGMRNAAVDSITNVMYV